MRVVWKSTLQWFHNTKIDMPVNAEIVEVKEQDGYPTIWYIADPYSPVSKVREFSIVGTGHEWNELQWKYVGTFHVSPYVWHVLEAI